MRRRTALDALTWERMDADRQKKEATDLLLAMRERGETADPRLDPMVYEEVRRLARKLMLSERASHTLQPTALAHEAYARLIDSTRVNPRDRGHFLALAARAMRRILVDHARRRSAERRGGGKHPVTLVDVGTDAGGDDLDLLELESALEALEAVDKRKALIVELRYFAGMSVADVAETMDLSKASIKSDWATARAWLGARLAR